MQRGKSLKKNIMLGYKSTMLQGEVLFMCEYHHTYTLFAHTSTQLFDANKLLFVGVLFAYPFAAIGV